MKDIKNVVIIVVIAIVVIFVLLGALRKSNEFGDIKSYVSDNKSELESVKDDYLAGNETTLPKEIEKVEIIKTENDTLVYFKMYDRTDKKSNIGFYYSEKDFPSALEKKEIDIIELGGDKYKWDEENTAGITNKISDNWYFYKKTK